MKRQIISLVAGLAAAGLVLAGCTQAAPEPTKAPAAPAQAAPTKAPAAPAAAAAPTKAPAAPTKAPAQPTAAPAQKVDWPQKGKTITVIVSWAAGGSVDVAARMLAPGLEKALGISVQVQNVPTAGGQAGFTQIAQAKPDGYTIGYTVLPTVASLAMDPERQAAFSRKSFTPVAMHVIDPGALGVSADGPYKTLKDFIDAGKANPEQVKVAVTAVAGPSHLDTLQLEKLTGGKFAVVHFDGGNPGLTAMLGGHVDAKMGNIGDFGAQLKTGKVRILGIMDTEESKFLPGVKTFKEQGVDLSTAVARGISVPAGTPKEIVDILSASIKQAMSDPGHIKKMEDMSQTVRYMDATEYGKYWDNVEQQIKPLMELVKR